ncbi:hypothetical protein [Rhizobium leguminosarum]
MKTLAARVAELEPGGVRYAGRYQRALEYRRGSVTTFAGSMWIALDDVPAGVQPGSNVALWQLSQKGEPRAGKQTQGRQQRPSKKFFVGQRRPWTPKLTLRWRGRAKASTSARSPTVRSMS